MITIILVRHGERTREQRDAENPLTPEAREKALKLGARLGSLIARPAVVLTSEHVHARQTAEALAVEAGLPNPVDAPFLTPRRGDAPGSHWADDRLHEALTARVGQGIRTVILVGHETRLSQLVLRFTGTRQRELGALDAISISADELARLTIGKGEVDWRYPVRNWLEQEIGEKLTSKMAVATFLASANFIALMEILIGQREVLLQTRKLWPEAWASYKWLLTFESSWPFIWLALFSHFSAAGLFIAAVYLYDRLSMPVGFWVLKPPRWIKPGDHKEIEKLLICGYPQAHMIRIWQCVFTPAVAFSTIGVFFLIATSGVGIALVAAAIVAILIMVVFHRHRPTGSID